MSVATPGFTAEVSAEWRPIGPYFEYPYSGAVGPFALASGSTYIATPAGIFKSLDNSIWTKSNEGLGLFFNRVRALVTDPSSPSTVYAGTYGGGVFKTTDAGLNWKAVNAGLTILKVQVMARAPGTASTIYAGTLGEVFRTTDGGATWTLLNHGLSNTNITSIVVDPISSSTVYVGTYSAGVFKSLDGGTTWFQTGLRSEGEPKYPGIYALAIDPSSPRIIYAGAYRRTFKSSDSGVSWTPLEGRPEGSASGAAALAIDPQMPWTLYAINDHGSWKSVDRGLTWAQLPAGAAGDVADFDPNEFSGTIEIDTSGVPAVYLSSKLLGLGRSTDGGATWETLTRGFVPSGVGRLAGRAQSGSSIYAAAFALCSDGSSCGGIFKSQDDGATWVNVSRGLKLQGLMASDPASDAIVYVSADEGLLKTTDGGATWIPINEGLPNSIYTGTPVPSTAIAIDPVHSATVYVGLFASGVFKSTDAGGHWAPTSLFGNVNALAVDPLSPATVYAGTWDQGLFKSVDAGTTWIAVDTGLPDLSIHRIAVDPLTPSTVYVATDHGISKSVDAGRSWVSMNEGLPGFVFSIVSLTLDPRLPSTIYVGISGFGLFRSLDGGEHWSRISPADGYEWGRDVLIVPSRVGSILYVADPQTGLYKLAPGSDRNRPQPQLVPFR